MMKKNKIIILCNVLILLTTVFCAFGAESKKPSVQTLPPKQENVQLQTPAPSQPAPVLSILQNAYSYNPVGKPDPFKPFVEAKVAPVKKEQAKAVAQTKVESIFPLQQGDVESFKLVGIMGDKSRRVAMVQDSAKKFYPLVIGTRIGLNNGKVIDILADRITVDEPAGKKIKRIILKLRNN